MSLASKFRYSLLLLSLFFPFPATCQIRALNIHQVFFIDGDNGIALASTDQNSVVLLSQSGGKKWTVSYQTSLVLHKALLQDSLSGWVVGGSG